jgi:undecaprenyl diphosphate synthase
MHVAIIMDGNGRWAARRHLPRSAGHRQGAKAVDAAVTAAARRRVDMLTLYAFSAANWQRPAAEVDALMKLFRRYLISQTPRCVEQSICINVIGRRDRLSRELREAIEHSEQATACGCGMRLRIAVDYSAQHSLMQICRLAHSSQTFDRQQFLELLSAVDHSTLPVSEVDLLIRTGGEKRLSDFLLWECAYAELHFVDCFWPDFDEAAFEAALNEFGRRERRFGALGETRSAEAAHA